MSEETKVTTTTSAEEAAQIMDKGKGKAPAEDMSMEDDESSSDEDEQGAQADEQPLEEADEDNMEEIDEGNILSGGRRTRGKAIDFAKAAQELGDEDDDEDDDADFEDPDDEMKE